MMMRALVLFAMVAAVKASTACGKAADAKACATVMSAGGACSLALSANQADATYTSCGMTKPATTALSGALASVVTDAMKTAAAAAAKTASESCKSTCATIAKANANGAADCTVNCEVGSSGAATFAGVATAFAAAVLLQ